MPPPDGIAMCQGGDGRVSVVTIDRTHLFGRRASARKALNRRCIRRARYPCFRSNRSYAGGRRPDLVG